MRILHVNDVASVGAILTGASDGRDSLYQPVLRRDLAPGALGSVLFAARRLGCVAELRGAYRSGNFTHCHVHYGTFAHLAELGGVPYSLHLHGGDLLLDLSGGLKRRLVLRAIERASHVVVSTPDLVEPARTLRADAVYVPNPIEQPRDPANRSTHAHPHIVLLSKMDRLKGWEQQVSLMERLVAVLPGIEITFFSHGQLPLALRRSLTSRLLSLGGKMSKPLSRPEYLAHIARHDFALGQLEVGSLGMSEMEAMAAGLPTIANVNAHRALGYEPMVIEPAEAEKRLSELWAGGEAARRAWADRGVEYLRRVHSPKQSLASLENVLLGDRVVARSVSQAVLGPVPK